MISDKITLLNQTVLECFNETDEKNIIKSFTEVGIKVLEADFGFVWLNSQTSTVWELNYKSHNLPFTPKIPRKGGRNQKVLRSGKIDYVTNVKEAPEAEYVGKFLKSFVIIPICYRNDIYGNIVICFKKPETFQKDKKVLCQFIGNSLAQAITIHRLIASEHEARILSQKNKEYFQALIENSYEIEMLVDKQGFIIYASPSVKKFFGVDQFEVVGRHIAEFVSDGSPDTVAEYLKRILGNPGTNHVIEFSYKFKEGSTRYLESTAYNMLHKPNVEGIVINMRDITSRRKLLSEKETQILLEEEKKKISFMAEANHELRTPLAIIKGNVDLILREARGSKRRYADNALHQIDEEVKHLSGILSDLSLLTTTNEESERRLNRKNVDLSKLLSKIISRAKVIARKKKILIKKEIPRIKVFGDAKYLDSLFLNIINNAIRYGKEKGWIKVKMVKEKENVLIEIQDNGIGIGEEDLSNIFNRFYRVDRSHTDAKRTGLGLAICKWITEAHGGTIEVKSTIGKGSTFTIKLPLKGLSLSV